MVMGKREHTINIVTMKDMLYFKCIKLFFKRHNMEKMVNLFLTAEFGLGERIQQIATWNKIETSDMIQGKSFVNKAKTRIRGTDNTKRDIVNVICTEKVANKILKDLHTELYEEDLETLRYFVTEINYFDNEEKELKEESKIMNNDIEALYIIVEKGYSEEVILLSDKVGARGATVIPAEGNKFASKHIAPGLDINPMKEIVLIITEESKSRKLMELLKEDKTITGIGKGIAYSIKVTDFSGYK